MKNNYSTSDLMHFYEVRMLALSEYSDRVWNRFNWFMTLQVAIFGFFFSQATTSENKQFFEYGIPLIGIVIALLWSLMGIEDYISLKKHKKLTNQVGTHAVNIFINSGLEFTLNKNKSDKFHQSWLLFIFPLSIVTIWAYVYVKVI